MKTKEEILKMTETELNDCKWSDDLDIKEVKNTNIRCSDCSKCSHCSNCFDCSNCSNCSYCFDCSNCSYCSHCSNCSNCSYCSNCSNCSYCTNCLYCRNLRDKREGYWICNVEVSKEEFEAKKKEIENK